MNEFQVDGMTLVGTGYPKDVETFLHVYEGQDYDFGLQGLEAPGVIWDVGASLGGFTLSMMKRFPGTKIVSVEANPYVAGLLHRNVQVGPGPDRVQVIAKALSANARSGSYVKLTITPGSTVGGSIRGYGSWEMHPAWKGVTREAVATVLCIGVRDLISEVNCSPNVLKLDCEGSEIEILEDLRDANRLCWIDRIIGEWHGIGSRHLVQEILRRTHDVTIVQTPGMPIGLFQARRKGA